MNKQNYFGVFAVVGASTFWALSANIASSLFNVGVSPFELAGVSTMLATFGLAIVKSFRQQEVLKQPNLQQFILGAVFALLSAVNYLAIAKLPVAVAIVLLFTAPGFVVLWKSLVSRKLPSLKVLIALGLSFVGVVLVSELIGKDVSQVNWFGIGVGLATAVFFAIYTMMSERIGSTGAPVDIMLRTFSVSSLVWLGFLLTQGVPVKLLDPANFLPVLLMGIAGNLIPYSLYLWSMRRVPAEQAVIIATLEPSIAGVIAWIWFGQQLTPLQIMGSVLVLVAIISLQIQKR